MIKMLGSCDHVWRFARRRPVLRKSCVVYIKRDVVGVRPLGKSKCHSDTREPRPHNRISVTIYSYVRLMVCDMFPTPQPLELVIDKSYIYN